jgi:hypothetical protein
MGGTGVGNGQDSGTAEPELLGPETWLLDDPLPPFEHWARNAPDETTNTPATTPINGRVALRPDGFRILLTSDRSAWDRLRDQQQLALP